MGVVIDFADALNEMNEGQHLMELVSEVSAILGRKYDTLDTNPRSEHYDAWMDKGPRTEVGWNNGVSLVFEPEATDKVTMKIYLEERTWGEGRRPVDLDRQYNRLARIYGVNGGRIASGVVFV